MDRDNELIRVMVDGDSPIELSRTNYSNLAALWERHGTLLRTACDVQANALATLFWANLGDAGSIGERELARILRASRLADGLPPTLARGSAPAAHHLAYLIATAPLGSECDVLDSWYDSPGPPEDRTNALLDVLAATIAKPESHRERTP